MLRNYVAGAFAATLVGCSSGSGDESNTTILNDDGSTTDISFLLNGQSAASSDSRWSCIASDAVTGARDAYVFAIWSNGRGSSSSIGTFTWGTNGADVEVTPDAGGFSIIGDLLHDLVGDRIVFTQFTSLGDVFLTGCDREFAG